MRPRNGLPLRKSLILAVIIGAHVLVVVVLSRTGKLYRSSGSEPPPDTVLFFFDWQPPPEEAPAPVKPQRAVQTRTEAPPESSTAITVPSGKPPETASIDWYAEAEKLGQERRVQRSPKEPRTFGVIPKSPFTPAPKKSWTPWVPQEKKAGFDGPFPYVRLGRRCMLMPPFFGCAIGKLPKSKGITLDEITDPDRPRSSVPVIEPTWSPQDLPE